MSIVDDLARDLADVRREIEDLRAASRIGFADVSAAIRRSRLGLTALEQEQSLARLRPPTTLIEWTPRVGQPADPEMDQSLISRLKRGDPVANTLGGTDPYTGVANMLINPVMTGFFDANSTGAEVVAANGWSIGHAVVSGSVTQNHTDDLYARGAIADDPFNSDIIGWDMAVAASSEADFVLRSCKNGWSTGAPGVAPVSFDPPPYLIAAFRLVRYGSTVDPDLESHYVQVRIIDTFDGSVIASSPQLDYVSLGAEETRRLYCSTAAGAAAFQSGHAYRAELLVHVKSKASGAAGISVFVGEPQLAYAFSPDPPPYQPVVAHWFPETIIAQKQDALIVRRAGDTQAARLRISADPYVLWGPGTAGHDLALRRSAAAALRVDANVTANPTVLEIESTSGQRNALALYVNGDTNDRLLLEGSATEQSIRFGPGNAATDRAIQTYYTGAVADTATHFIPSANLPTQGCAMLVDDGNSCVGVMMWYRNGTFNGVWGTSLGGTSSYEFRGTTLSAGAGTFSWYMEGNNANDRLAVKNNAGFSRGFRLLILSG